MNNLKYFGAIDSRQLITNIKKNNGSIEERDSVIKYMVAVSKLEKCMDELNNSYKKYNIGKLIDKYGCDGDDCEINDEL